MIEAAQAAKVVLGTNHHLRCAVTHRTLRRMIKESDRQAARRSRLSRGLSSSETSGWRLTRPEAGGGVILDITVHDADALRFVLDAEAQDVLARSVNQGLAQQEDAVMGVISFEGGIAQFHDAFTIKYAPTGLEVHGTEGSLIAVDVMSQDPKGRLCSDAKEMRPKLDWIPEDLYAFSISHFNRAVQNGAQPFATGEDGFRSLAVALAALESSKSGNAPRFTSTKPYGTPLSVPKTQ